MPFCPADCEDTTLTPIDPGTCDLDVRTQGINKIGFFICDASLPSPFDCTALETLVGANQLVFSSPLAEIEVTDPTQEQIRVAQCLPSKFITTERVINFQDRVMKDTPSGTSPTTDPVPYSENDFWADKVDKNPRLRYMFVFCDGTVQVARDASGTPIEATLNAFRSYENVGSGSTLKTITYIKASLTFAGDPLDLNQKPELTAGGVPFNINACEI